MQTSLLMQLVKALDAGQLKVVDLTTPLGPDTVEIDLPPIFASSPGVTISQISKFDSAGPAWDWITITMGEHTCTHLDSPFH